jgi:hypothetical protein
MSSGSNFFICACAILVFSIINYKIGPIINYRVGTDWALANCEELQDQYDAAKELNPNMSDEEKESYAFPIRRCRNKKAMHNMEHTSVVFNGVIGFICVLLGLYGLQKEVIPKTGTIGMACGVVGFILTLVYVIYNGVVYNNYYDRNIYKVDGDGAFAELDGSSYECFYYNKPKDDEALIAKYSDLIKSQYNYNKDLKDSFNTDSEKVNCQSSPSLCATREYLPAAGSTCKKLYYRQIINDYENYDKSARFLTALLLSIITLLCYCGLIFSGFTLSKEQS